MTNQVFAFCLMIVTFICFVEVFYAGNWYLAVGKSIALMLGLSAMMVTVFIFGEEKKRYENE